MPWRALPWGPLLAATFLSPWPLILVRDHAITTPCSLPRVEELLTSQARPRPEQQTKKNPSLSQLPPPCWQNAGAKTPSFYRRALTNLGFSGGSDRKESACNAGDLALIPGLGRSPGEGNGNPLQYSCLENPMDRGAWQAAVQGLKESDTIESLTTRKFI